MSDSDGRAKSSAVVGRHTDSTLYGHSNVNGSSRRVPAKNRRTLHQENEHRANRGILRGGLIVVIALCLSSSLTTNAWIDRVLRRSALAVTTRSGDAIMMALSQGAAATSSSTGTIPAVGGGAPNGTRVTFVCDMACEMGNMLSHIAYCAALASWMESVHKVGSDLVLRHVGRNRQWESSRDDIRACFPRLSNRDFSLARTPEFSDELDLRMQEQERTGLTLAGINSDDLDRVGDVLADVTRHAALRTVNRHPNSSITLPFLVARKMIAYDGNALLDRHYDEIRDLFVFDTGACCAARPDPDETVFHLRNFKAEVKPEIAERRGFKELGPKQTANDLLGHLRPGDKVAVLSRFASDEVDQYLAAMRDRGLVVRFINGQTSRQDFCFLLSAQKEVVGVSISTYFYWAARLSNATRVITYSLDVPSVWNRKGIAFFNYNYTHPRLRGRQWVFRMFRPDESSNATVGRSIVAPDLKDPRSW